MADTEPEPETKADRLPEPDKEAHQAAVQKIQDDDEREWGWGAEGRSMCVGNLSAGASFGHAVPCTNCD
jgi:hypothetical protein